MAFWVMFFISLAFTVAGELLRPKQKFDDAKPSALGDFSFPTADASRVIPWFWGTCKLQGPNTVWFGDYSMVPIVKTVKTGWFSSDQVTQGFRHHLGVQLIFAWGEIDEFIAWIADDKEVKIQDVVETADKIDFYMFDPTFISADEPWSGLQGSVTLYKGTTTQLADDYLAQQWADTETEISAFRRVCYAVMKKCWIGNSETPPPFGIIARRTPNQLGLTGGKENINGDANIACAAYEIMIDTLKGLKIPPTKIDTASFIACGNTLFDEGLGISMLVDTPMIGKDLLSDMLRHADGVIYPDPVTGLYTMALARKDYDVETLPVFDDSNVETDGFEFTRSSWEETKNNVTVNFTCREENFQVRPVTYQDLANIDVRNGTIDSETIDFLGFSNYTQARAAASRAGKTRSSPVCKCSFTTNREGYDLRPGSVLKLTKQKYGISNLVMRVIDISYGTLDDPRIRVTCVEDIFAVNAHAYDVSPGSGWVPPNGATISPLLRKAFEEVPYEMLGAEQRAIMALGTRDDGTSVTGFEVWSDPTGGTAYAMTALSRGVIASGTLQSTYGLSVADDPVGFVVSDVQDIDLLSSITADERAAGANICKIGNEYLAWKTVSVAGGQATITEVLRGVFDTLQEVHPAGSVVWFFNETIPLASSTPYAADLTLKGKLMSVDRTRRQDIVTDTSTPLSISTISRAFRPNPPGKVRVNGTWPPSELGVTGAISLTWEHRNRLLRQVVSQDATGIASEPNVTYTIEVRNAATNALIVSKSNLAGPNATLKLVSATVKVLLYSVLSGAESWRAQSFTTQVTSDYTTNVIEGVESVPGDGGGGTVIDGGVPSEEPAPPPPGPGEEPAPPGGTGSPPSGSLPALTIGATVVSVATYGAVGDGTTDDSAAVQAAINALPAGGGTVQGVAGKVYLLDPAYQDCNNVDADRCAIKMKSNVRLDFSTCSIKLKNTNSDHYYGIYAWNINNFEIIVNRITGYRYDPAFLGTTTTTREWGHNIAVYGCDLWIIRNTTTEKASGDGIGIGGRSTTAAATNGYIDNVVANDNRRQGMSIGHCDGIWVTKSKFNKTRGTNPQSGVDLEMDNQTDPTMPFVKNVHFTDCDFDDNWGPGVQGYYHGLNWTFTNCNIRRTNSGYGAYYFYDSSQVTISGGEVRDNKGPGFNCRKSDNISVADVTFFNNRVSSRGNHPTGPTVTFSGTSNPEWAQHCTIGAENTAISFGSNTYGPTDA